MTLQLAHGEGNRDQGLEANPAGRRRDDLLYLHSVLKRNFDRLAQVAVEAYRSLARILGKRPRHSSERRSAGAAADLDDVVDGEIRLRHDRRIEKSAALAVVFGETAM